MPDPLPNIPTAVAPERLAQYLVDRLGLAADKQDTAREFFVNLTPIILEQISAAIDVPFPARSYYDEAVYVSGRRTIALTENWPIASITAAKLGTQPLKIGNLYALNMGQCDIAIAQGYRGIQLSQWVANYAPTTIFVTYQAGYDSLPPDLLEVFTEWSFLVMKEKDRVGQKSTKIDVGLMNFTRDVPPWAEKTLWRYRRMESYAS